MSMGEGSDTQLPIKETRANATFCRSTVKDLCCQRTISSHMRYISFSSRKSRTGGGINGRISVLTREDGQCYNSR